MKKFLMMLAMIIGFCVSFTSCESANDNEDSSEKVMLSLKPTLEISSTDFQTRTEENTVYAAMIEKLSSTGEMNYYCWGMFTDINKMFLLIDKGTYNIKISSMDKSKIENDYFYDNLMKNKFGNDEHYFSYLVDYVNYGTPIGNNYYGETKNITITKSSDINVDLKYMTFGVVLKGKNLLKTDKLKLKFFNYNWTEISINYNNPYSNVIKCKMPGLLSKYYNNSDIGALEEVMISLNDADLFNEYKQIQIERKKITTFEIDCKRMGITKEDSTLTDGNTITY